MHILPYDYFSGQSDVARGLARLATLIRAARQQVENAILVDNGDFLSGVPAVDDLLSNAGGQSALSRHHPIVTAMNMLKYDAGNLGNHDFDLGFEFVEQISAQADYPVISANALWDRADNPLHDKTLFRPYTILKRTLRDRAGQNRELKIGLVGFLPPQSVPQFYSNAAPILTRDIIQTAQAYVPEIRALGADIIIALAHSGISGAKPAYDMENAIVPLALVPGIDAIIAGHSHQLFPGDVANLPDSVVTGAGEIHGVPVVCAGFWGSHLGIIDLTLEMSGQNVKVQGHETNVRPVVRRDAAGQITHLAPADRQVIQAMAHEHRRTKKHIHTPVGTTTRPISSCFALVAQTSAIQLIHQAQEWYVRTFLSKNIEPDTPLLSAACPYKCGGPAGPGFFTRIPAGKLTQLSVADLCYYPNTLELLSITGAGLLNWLERAASVFGRVRPGADDQYLKLRETPCYSYDSIYGVEYAIDLSRPALYTPYGDPVRPGPGRIRNLTYKGNPIRPDLRFTVITNSFRQGGGGRYPGTGKLTMPRDTGIATSTVVRDFIRQHQTLEISPRQNWSFVPVKGASVNIRTAAFAGDYLHEVAHLDITDIGQDAEGFSLFRLRL